jgi:hypothetical protein
VSARILGREVTAPSGVAWRAVKVLVGVYPGGVTGKELNESSHAANACQALLKLTQYDLRWRRVLIFPKMWQGTNRGPNGLYSIQTPAPRAWAAGTSYNIAHPE